MTDYGIVKSTVKPEPIKIDEYSVYVCTDIKPFTEEIDDETFEGWEYHMVQYGKDEYIIHQQTLIEEQITNTQLALCELVEEMEVQNG